MRDTKRGRSCFRDRLVGFLFVILGISGLVIIASPFMPSYTFDIREEQFGLNLQQEIEQLETKDSKKYVSPVPTRLLGQQALGESPFASPVISTSYNNRLEIPKINVDVALVEGEDWKAMDNGAWRLPSAATPLDEEGNIVISGHRFAFWGRNRRIFYYLDKLKVGDEIKITWQGKDYYYLVKGNKVVWPDQTEVLEQTREKKLTLITCTPIGTANQRIIVEAIPFSLNTKTAKVL